MSRPLPLDRPMPQHPPIRQWYHPIMEGLLLLGNLGLMVASSRQLWQWWADFLRRTPDVVVGFMVLLLVWCVPLAILGHLWRWRKATLHYDETGQAADLKQCRDGYLSQVALGIAAMLGLLGLLFLLAGLLRILEPIHPLMWVGGLLALVQWRYLNKLMEQLWNLKALGPPPSSNSPFQEWP